VHIFSRTIIYIYTKKYIYIMVREKNPTWNLKWCFHVWGNFAPFSNRWCTFLQGNISNNYRHSLQKMPWSPKNNNRIYKSIDLILKWCWNLLVGRRFHIFFWELHTYGRPFSTITAFLGSQIYWGIVCKNAELMS
jgi:hypothetical protein